MSYLLNFRGIGHVSLFFSIFVSVCTLLHKALPLESCSKWRVGHIHFPIKHIVILKMKKLFSFLLVALLAVCTAHATVPLKRTKTHTQKDGTTLTVKVIVQGNFLIYSTSDGFAVLPNEQGDYTYAVPTANGYDAGTVVAHEPADRSEAEREYVANTAVLMPFGAPAEKYPTRGLKSFATTRTDGLGTYGQTANGTLPSIGAPVVPVIMVEFPDEHFLATTTEEELTKMFNSEGYTDAATNANIAGSVRDYFKSQSDGLFTPTFKVVAKVMAKNGYAYYGANVGSNNSYRVNELITEVLQTATTAGKSFSEFVVSDKGGVPLVFIYYAGSSESNSRDATRENRLWPHYSTNSRTVGGVKFNSYLVSNEQFFVYKRDASGKRILTDANGFPIVDSTKTVRDGIGLACHELGHALGLPDFYTTYGAEHDVPTPDFWSVMDGGCYWDNGYRPVGYTAYERNLMGWLQVHDLTTAQACELYPFGSGADKPMAYRIVNPNNSKEYLLMENRTKGTWYPAELSGGMLVTHVNYDATTWNNNRVNNTASAMGYQVVAADGMEQTASSIIEAGGDWRAAFKGDLYPGTSNVTEVASWKVYSGTTLEKPIYNIAYDSKDSHIITFSFLDQTLVSGIEGVATEKSIGEAVVYDLQGRRVTQPTHGLYIINGRKVLVP